MRQRPRLMRLRRERRLVAEHGGVLPALAFPLAPAGHLHVGCLRSCFCMQGRRCDILHVLGLQKKRKSAAEDKLLPDTDAAPADLGAGQQAATKEKRKKARAAESVHGNVMGDGSGKKKKKKKANTGSEGQADAMSLGGQRTTDMMQVLVG